MNNYILYIIHHIYIYHMGTSPPLIHPVLHQSAVVSFSICSRGASKIRKNPPVEAGFVEHAQRGRGCHI